MILAFFIKLKKKKKKKIGFFHKRHHRHKLEINFYFL